VIESRTINALWSRVTDADDKYGNFASTHEALGVALEEWHELIDAIQANDGPSIEREALDLAAVLIRLYDHLTGPNSKQLRSRSGLERKA
jgi:NTP pyrophosphatase (non-canonical NTP hydrolase)